VILLLVAAVLGGTFLAWSAQAGSVPPPGHRHGHEAVGGRSGLGSVDLKGWAKEQISSDKERRAQPRPKTAVSPTAARSGAVTAVRQAGFVRAAAAADPTTLVLYDTAGPYGRLGELYAMAAANLAGHFGTVTAKPVQQYTAGMIGSYTAVIYIGSTYYCCDVPDAIPAAFYQDVSTSTKPVIWMGANIWNMANSVGTAQFTQRYGWDPTSSYYEDGGSVGTVT